MSPFPCEMAKSFVRAWQGSSSVGWQCQAQSTLQPLREAPTKPQEILFPKWVKKGQKYWTQQRTKPSQRSGEAMGQAQIPAPGNDLLCPMAVPGSVPCGS